MNKIIAALFLAGLMAVPLSAQLTIVSQPSNTYTNLIIPAVITAGGVSNLTSQPISITPGLGIGLQATYVGTALSTSNTTVKVNVSMDGTNYMTTAPITITFALTGTTTNTVYTNFGSVFFESARTVRVDSWTSVDTISNFFPVKLLLGRAKQEFSK
jgi:hypothetical protein